MALLSGPVRQAEWENATLSRFFEALSAVPGDGHEDDKYAEPSWAPFASALVAATGYE